MDLKSLDLKYINFKSKFPTQPNVLAHLLPRHDGVVNMMEVETPNVGPRFCINFL